MAAWLADLAGFLLSRFSCVVSNPCFRRLVALLGVLWRAFMKIFPSHDGQQGRRFDSCDPSKKQVSHGGERNAMGSQPDLARCRACENRLGFFKNVVPESVSPSN